MLFSTPWVRLAKLRGGRSAVISSRGLNGSANPKKVLEEMDWRVH